MPAHNVPLAAANPLAGLHNIIEPNSASWWPLPPIYYVLLVAIVTLIALAIFIFKKKQKTSQKQKQLLSQLTRLKESKGTFVELNQLLKIVALNYFERELVASLHGKTWLDFLQRYSSSTLSGSFLDEKRFIKQLYTDSEPCAENDFLQAQQWIKQLPKQIKNKKGAENV